jgi:hypothetical protein
MTGIQRAARVGAAALFIATAGACSTLGSLGNVLGGGSDDITGTVQGIDTRLQQVFLQQSNGQTVGIGYDSRTQVVYQNQTYSVNSLERGDQITARITSTGNNNSNYYTDYIRVDQSVTGSGGASGSVQTIQGNVQSVNYSQGWFIVRTNNNLNVTVSLPYNANRTDVNRFNNLRNGDYVRMYAVYLNSQRAELRNFY